MKEKGILAAKRHRRRLRGKERPFNDLSRLRIFRKLLACGRESVPWQQCQNCGANLKVSVDRSGWETTLKRDATFANDTAALP